MLFRECLDIPCGIRFMFDDLQLQSACGRSRLLHSPMMQTKAEVEKAYATLEGCYGILYKNPSPQTSSTLAALKHRLMCLRDISGTLDRLQRDVVLDDVDLFEIKYVGLLSGHVKEGVEALGLEGVIIPDMEKVVSILDPEGMKIESFYVYDIYSKELGRIRVDIKKLQGLSTGCLNS